MTSRDDLTCCSRIVIKVGSQLLAEDGEGVTRRIAAIVASRPDLQVIVVSSGAVALGSLHGLPIGPNDSLERRQAAAAIGQPRLMRLWDSALAKVQRKSGQVLLTRDDLADRERYLNARATVRCLLENGIVPIVNENDTVVFEEIRFGDNDRLAAQVSALTGAGALFLLTNVDGLLTKNGTRVAEVTDIDQQARPHLRALKSAYGTGGMASKLDAAGLAGAVGIPTVILNGRAPEKLAAALQGDDIGTFFVPNRSPLAARKHWLAFSTHPAGVITVDDGAHEALTKRGKSLLAAGVLAVRGDFSRGAIVALETREKGEFARGLSAYSASELVQIRGQQTADISATLGYICTSEVIHRDDMVLQAPS